jgi:extracellular elastinolytic metalloproteinase
MMNPTMFRSLFLAPTLTFAACAVSDGNDANDARDHAIDALQHKTGARVAFEANELGTTRVLDMTPRFPAPSRFADPAAAAARFLTEHHDAFQLSASDASSFVATSVDLEPDVNVGHVTLQRMYNGVPVFQGSIQLLIDGGNNVVRATADELFRIGPPTNRLSLSPLEAANAAARSYGLALSLGAGTTEGRATVFESASLLDPLKVEPYIFQVALGDDRYAYQVLVSWADENKEQQYQLALVDAHTGDLLFDTSLVNTFTGRVFTATVFPRTTDTTDRRVVVSFNGNATASPSGWVNTTRRTQGNNVVACTDLNANNACGTNEVQPTANSSDAFDFPYSPTQDATNFRAAAVTNAFFYANDFHDRTYALGFNEASRNFQLSNFGRGGAQNDPVNVDVADGSGTNNANFATPPDGSRPRMQMFLFNRRSSTVRQDSSFDGSVVYHEYAHGLSNRLVGGGSTACLRGLQSGGMGEGWGDFIGSSFRNDPIVGAYVTGNNTTGIRRASMANSPFTYNDVRNGNLNAVHAVGELWAATLWDIRRTVGAAVIERIVVQGMKNTPCNPTILQARDGLISADASLNGGANRCTIFRAFAARQMGSGAASPNHNSTTAIVLSTAVPAGC